MIAGLAFGSEIKRFGGSRITRAALVVLVLLPLCYSALYMWAYWNPFGQLNHLPVALVNADRGAEMNGQRVNVGAQVTKSLDDDRSLDWHVVDEAAAEAGIQSGKYYFMVELPENFSEAIASPVTGSPERAQLKVVYNDANSFISSTVGKGAMNQVVAAVSTRISGQAVNEMLSQMLMAGGGVRQAADGATLLADGADQLAAGNRELAEGTQQLASKVTQATDPLLQVATALSQLRSDPKQFQQGADALAAAADKLEADAAAQDAVAKGLGSAVEKLSDSSDPEAREVASQLAELRGQLAAHQYTPEIRAQARTAKDAAVAFQSAFGAPGSPLGQALDHVAGQQAQIAAKLAEVRGGVTKLNDGAHQLADGSARLAAGNRELATKLQEGANNVPQWSDEQRQAIADTISAPVQLDSTHHNAAPYFGVGMSPFFISLSLFFGTLMLWMVFRALSNRAIAAEALPIRVVLSSYLPVAALASCQAAVVFLVVNLALGLHPAHPAGMLGFMVLASCVFVALVQAINAFFGATIGKVLAMMLLMVQLVSSGGLYPVETTAKPFQVLHAFDPMSYSVTGLRELVSGGIEYRLWQSIAVLALVGIGSLVVSMLAARRDRMWTLTRLIPQIKTG
ncbi:YhgE/Pip domain-containing protein [Segniliparus rugosus]|uniref:YhgE/Pip domain-containing protein n=1 Tax=Segniliparus rugosus (strain ATCC BAA-974 / DSM 45345 / CCUG 50838 / CIP 108380 / JCM 13579 / CDC 945) TaxID=679197 RepID=U1N9B6_SEGRC|nr:YhgE/Pip domain-containing protein [Segniliparus rugosus]ERG69388.1 YhgE/Pip domain-containing protein [Segniliparus rugosus ATCC BAA-974]